MQEFVLETLNQYAHNPALIYTFVFLFMYASSFGLPIPEELTLLTVGFLVYLGMESDPTTAMNPHTAAAVCFVAVLSSDFLVFWLGKRLGTRVLKIKLFANLFTDDRLKKIESWIERYGQWACGVFRFTPGLRFPGHLMCGMLKLSTTRFLLVDGFCALLTVPTQVYAVAYFGNEIISAFKSFKIGLISILVVVAAVYFTRKYILNRRNKNKLEPLIESSKVDSVGEAKVITEFEKVG